MSLYDASSGHPHAGRDHPYEQQLRHELTAVGIRGSLHGRIMAEIADHLECEPEAVLGEPRALARQFADVVGSARAKTAAVAAFASLVVAAIAVLAVARASSGLLRSAQPVAGALHGPPPLVTLAAAVLAGAAQVAFAAGLLGAVRWLRHRNEGVLAAAEAAVILRRAALGVGAGLVSMACLAVVALAGRHHSAAPSAGLVIGACSAGAVALLAAIPSLRAAARLRPLAEGDAGDVIDDLGPLAPTGLRGRPWRLAGLVAAALALLLTVAGVAASDPYDGAARGIIDGLGCLLGFAALGPWLGLWSPRGRRGLAA